jgi:hypothetical protein
MHANQAIGKAKFYRGLAEGYRLLGRPQRADSYETAAQVFERLAAKPVEKVWTEAGVITQSEPAQRAGS